MLYIRMAIKHCTFIMHGISQELLNKIVHKAIKYRDIHGAVFHIQTKDQSLNLLASAGNLEPESSYYIASINKMMLTFITLQLCRQHVLDLNDPLSKYFSDSILDGLLIYNGKNYAYQLTIRHLLTQTSGLPCYLIDKRPDGIKNMDLLLKGKPQTWPLEKVIGEVKSMKPAFSPGAQGRANYAETNFRILGRILELCTYKPIQELLTDLFAGLQMKNTFVLPAANRTCAPVYYRQKELDIKDYWLSTKHDIASTAADQMIFIRSFFDGKHLTGLQIDGLRNWNRIFFPFKYGMGIQKFHIPRIMTPFKRLPQIIGHSGSSGAVAFYIPDKDLYLTGTVNQSASVSYAFRIMMNIINRL